MQLAAPRVGMRLTSPSDLHSPPHIHSPPRTAAFAAAARSDLRAVHEGRLSVAAAQPWTPGHTSGLRVAALAIRADGTTGNAHADAALRTAAQVDAVLSQRFQRHGIDGRGGAVELVINAPDRANAYWDADARRVELGDGDGVTWGAFGASLSVMSHELYHGVIDSEVRLDYHHAEQAALHESLADVFAAGVIGSWRIGEDVLTPGVPGDAIRDLAEPAITHLADAQAAGGQSHALSGVASLAAVRAATAIGMEAVQQVWYGALVNHLTDGAGFTDAARATLQAAAARFGAASSQHTAIRQAWESVGVLA